MTPDIIWVQEVVFPIMGMILGGFAMFGVYKIWNRHLDRTQGKHLLQGSAELKTELERLRERIEGLETGDRRLEELEERMDFAERVLAQRDDPRPLHGGE